METILAFVKNLPLFVLHFIRDLIYGPDGRPSLLDHVRAVCALCVRDALAALYGAGLAALRSLCGDDDNALDGRQSS